MATTDHVAAAHAGLAVALGERAGVTERQVSVAAAQVHATLAVAEELRTANLIARVGLTAIGQGGNVFRRRIAEIDERLDGGEQS